MLLSKKRHALVTIVFALVAFVDIRTVRGLEFDALATNAGSNEILNETEQVRVLKSEKSSESSKSEDEKEKKSESYDTESSRAENIEPAGKQRLSSTADSSSQMFAHARVDEIPEPRISIGRPTNIIGSSPATTPGSGGGSVPLSFFDTQYNTNAARPGSNSYLFPQPGGSNPVTPAPRPVTPAPRPVTNPPRPVTPVNPVPRPANTGVFVPLDRPGTTLAELSASPTDEPSATPTDHPTPNPTPQPTPAPTPRPTRQPTLPPTGVPTVMATPRPTRVPTPDPTRQPTKEPTRSPTKSPSASPVTWLGGLSRPALSTGASGGFGQFQRPAPTDSPSSVPSGFPSMLPSLVESSVPSSTPSVGEVIIIETESTEVESTEVESTEAESMEAESTETEQATENPTERPTPRPTGGGNAYGWPTFSPTTWLPTTTFQPTILYPWLKPANHFHDEDDADSRVDLDRGGGSSFEDLNDNAANTPQNEGPQNEGVVGSASVIAPTPYPTHPAVSVPGSGVNLPVDRPGNFLVELSPSPTDEPSATPTDHPTPYPTYQPTPVPTPGPTREPTLPPTGIPTVMPTPRPSVPPTLRPTGQPSTKPTPSPSKRPTPFPTTWIESIGRDTVISNGGFNFPTPSELPSDFPSMEPSLVLADAAVAGQLRPYGSPPPTTWLPTETLQPTTWLPTETPPRWQQWHQNQGGRRTSTEGEKLEE